MLLTVSSATACGGQARPATITVGTDVVAVSDLAGGAAGLCQARSEADADPQAARATFFDRSHQAIHTLARALETVDRAMAARLLEAKQTVEADYATGVSAPPLSDDLTTMALATDAGVARLKVVVAACGR